ncbi:MAG: PKD repeat protein [Saprospiraceae bacterium]|jgi:PKD repeat protein
MKKSLLLINLLIYCFCVQAQITLTLADMPSAGDSQSSVDVDDISNVSIGTAGSNQTYDFSDFSGLDTTVSNFISPAGTPGVADFPSADLVVEAEGDYTYIDISSSVLNFLGATVDTASAGPPSYFSLVFNPSQKIFELPTTYGTNFTDESGFSITIDGSQAGFDSIRILSSIVREIDYDGYGTITTPLGSFSGLREEVISTSYDTTQILFFGTWQTFNTTVATDTSYNWYSKLSKGPLVSVTIENGTVLSASYQLLTPTVVVPTANFSYTNQGGGTIDFTDQSSNIPTSWLWDFGDGNTSTQQNPQHTYAAPGTYTVCLTVTNSAGSDVVCQNVDISFAPVAAFMATDQGGGLVDFTDQSTNSPTSWLWDFGDGNTSTQQNPQHTYSSPGTYTVCLTVTNSSGSNTVCQDVTIILAPVAAFTFTDQGGGMVDFIDQSSNSPTSWLWDFGDGNTSTMQNPQYNYVSNGMYTVCLTASNSAGADQSCQTVDVIVTAVDDISDQFKVALFPNPVSEEVHLTIESNEVEQLQFKIFNATGQLVVGKSLSSSGQYSFQMGDFASGIYFYLLINKEGQIAANGKLIKE